MQFNRVILKVISSLGPSLTTYPLFHPQFECVSSKVSKFRYHFLKLDITSEDVQDLRQGHSEPAPTSAPSRMDDM
jgi:hypothetical protein